MLFKRGTLLVLATFALAACSKAAPDNGRASSQSARVIANSPGRANSLGPDAAQTDATAAPKIPFSAVIGADNQVTGIVANMWQDFGIRQIILDTGSPYFLAPRSPNEPKQECEEEHSLQFIQGGSATYCPGTSALDLVNDSGNPSAFGKGPLVAGVGTFTGTPTNGILGLACNVTGQNQPDMVPTIYQLEPSVLSFAFPDGAASPGTFTAAPLSGTYAAKHEVSLRDPSHTLGFGYVARIVKIEFKSGGKVMQTLLNDMQSPKESERGIWFIDSAGKKQLLFFSGTLAAFIDTGLGPPISLRDGTASLFGDQVASGIHEGSDTTGTFDSFTLTLEGTDGSDIVLDSGDLSTLSDTGWSRNLFEYRSLLNVAQIYVVLGLNFLAKWDLEFGFQNGRCAKSVTFAERK